MTEPRLSDGMIASLREDVAISLDGRTVVYEDAYIAKALDEVEWLRDQLDRQHQVVGAACTSLDGYIKAKYKHSLLELVHMVGTQLDRANEQNICWAEGVEAAEEEAAKAIAGTDGLWDCVCAPEPGAMHSHDCPAYLRQSVENIVTANQSLRDQLGRATKPRPVDDVLGKQVSEMRRLWTIVNAGGTEALLSWGQARTKLRALCIEIAPDLADALDTRPSQEPRPMSDGDTDA